MSDRILKNSVATISVTFNVNDVAVDPSPDSATVRIVRDNGTELVATTAADDAGIGVFSSTLTPDHTAQLDSLTATWTATYGSYMVTASTTHEIVGGFLFTIAEARAQNPLSDTVKYPTDRLTEMRATVEQALEDELGYALVPRYARLRASGGLNSIRTKPYVRAVRWATVDGIAMTAPDVALLTYDSTGFVYSTETWTTGHGNVTVGYEHGLDGPSAEAKRAGLVMLKQWMLASPVDDRTATFTSTEGGTYSLVVPGRGGSIWGIPEADSFVQRHRLLAIA